MRIRCLLTALGVGIALSACASERESSEPGSATPTFESAAPRKSEVLLRRPLKAQPYQPGSDEEFINGKRLAGRVAQQALTYERGATPRDVAAALPRAGVGRARLARVLDPVVQPGTRSVGRVIYPQLSGVTSISLGAMVVVRQRLQSASGENRVLTRVLDVRLRRAGGPWSLDRIVSVGGSPVPRPASLPPAAMRALDSPNITMSDSARWDIHRGAVDTALLAALVNAARDQRFSIAVFRAGHPPNVWETTRASAHSRGFAADIYAVDGRLVITQRLPEGPAYELASSLYANGATQLGSPWTFGTEGARSFTDAVHQDHIHVQQSPVS